MISPYILWCYGPHGSLASGHEDFILKLLYGEMARCPTCQSYTDAVKVEIK